ncbi:hypothetical protein [Bradyrhizobium sp. 6(2017)]|uniref:hypothetical protein n=1 Tax=Bradyrhizobium sp. 6(2017) TaxID=1197460 RepID=UPI0013E1C48C|nr:hypothetical protein [Bradyrhizobium sp. 6(2017)]QIG98119.1 hypothetical protein G6P99_41890 [Bradyrhizobium sp. 6(2017)]
MRPAATLPNRSFPDPKSNGRAAMMSITNNFTVDGAWIEEGEVNIPEANGEELNVLARKIESGFRHSLSYSKSEDPEDHGS